MLYWKTRWDSSQVLAELRQVDAQVLQGLHVRLEHRALRVGHEDHSVDALEHELAGRVVEDLARNRVELDAGLEAGDRADFERQQVEEERAVGLGLERDHLAAGVARRVVVDELEIRRLAAQTRAVVDDLHRHLHRAVVEGGHGGSRAPGQGARGLWSLPPRSPSSTGRGVALR